MVSRGPVDRREILDVIRRTAAANGGVPLGTASLAKHGVTSADWRRYWARIGDAQREAGLAPNKLIQAQPTDDIIAKLAALARQLGTFPTTRDIDVKRRQDPEFPSGRVFRRLGNKVRLARLLEQYAQTHPDYDDVAAMCASVLTPEATTIRAAARLVRFGSVYLLKGQGHRYKVGRTNAFGRRQRELAIQLPFETRKVHVIECDDPEGIERYWHTRFAAKRINSEWFELDADDVATFKRWKRLR